MAKRLTTPISYYGGKINLVSKIVPIIDYSKKQFVSLFTGGGAIEFAKQKHDVEVWNDLDGGVINFWECLQDDKLFDKLIFKIKSSLHSEQYHKLAGIILKNPKRYSRADKAWAFWMQSNTSFGNKIFGGFAFANDNSRNNLLKIKRENFRKEFYERVKNIQIFNRDAINLLETKDTPDTTFFADPPYISSDCGQYSGLFNNYNMEALLKRLAKIKGSFLLTSYPEDVLMDYRKKFDWIADDSKIVLAIDGKRKEKKYKIECITMNYRMQYSMFDKI